MDIKTSIALVIAILFNALAHAFLKFGMVRTGDIFDKGVKGAIKIITTNPFVIVGVIFFGISLIVYTATLSRLDLSIAYPILTTGGLALVTILSIGFFAEPLGFMRILGLMFLSLGVWIISMF